MPFLLAWSRHVAHNKAVDLRRRLNHRRAESLDDMGIDPVDMGASNIAEAERLFTSLDSLLEMLRAKQPFNCRLAREHHLNGRSIKELAKETGLTEHAIHNRLHRALNFLRCLAKSKAFSDECQP